MTLDSDNETVTGTLTFIGLSENYTASLVGEVGSGTRGRMTLVGYGADPLLGLVLNVTKITQSSGAVRNLSIYYQGLVYASDNSTYQMGGYCTGRKQ
jgi:hypothetical protein